MHITEASLNTSAPRNRDGLIIIHLFFFKGKKLQIFTKFRLYKVFSVSSQIQVDNLK